MKVQKFRYSSEEVAAAADFGIVNAFVTILFILGCVCVGVCTSLLLVSEPEGLISG